MNPVPVDARITDWPRRVANAINSLIFLFDQRRQYPFEQLDADPANPERGRTYYNNVTNKVRTYDGSTWRDLW